MKLNNLTLSHDKIILSDSIGLIYIIYDLITNTSEFSIEGEKAITISINGSNEFLNSIKSITDDNTYFHIENIFLKRELVVE